MGVALLTHQPLLFHGAPASPFDWVVMPLTDDRSFTRGELGMPRTQRDKLTRLSSAGVSFDIYLIAHEIRKGHELGETPSLKDLQHILDVPIDEKFEKVNQAVKTLSAVAFGVAVGTLVIAAAPVLGLAALANPDPVLIGAMTADGSVTEGTLSVFFEIVRW